jgi:hypothetical protein
MQTGAHESWKRPELGLHAAADTRSVRQREVTIPDFDYILEPCEFENGRGFVVVRLADGQHLRWQTLPRRKGLQSMNSRVVRLTDNASAPATS